MTFICPNDTQDPLSFRPMPFKHALSLHRINYFGKLDSFDDSAHGFDGGDLERALTICLRSEAVILIWFDYFAFSFLEYQVFWLSHTRRKKIKSVRFISKFDYLKINLWKQNNFFLYLITSRKKIIEKFFVPFCISNSYTSTNRMATAAAAAAKQT